MEVHQQALRRARQLADHERPVDCLFVLLLLDRVPSQIPHWQHICEQPKPGKCGGRGLHRSERNATLARHQMGTLLVLRIQSRRYGSLASLPRERLTTVEPLHHSFKVWCVSLLLHYLRRHTVRIPS